MTGSSDDVRYVVGLSTLGAIALAGSAKGIHAIALGDDHAACVADILTRGAAIADPDDATLGAWLERVVAFLDHPTVHPSLPLALQGTAFQRRVWSALTEVPAGQTTTYVALAASLGDRGLVRAVGTACAANPIAVLIPCHRVVRSDGGLAGYRWGLERKHALLAREARANPGPALQL